MNRIALILVGSVVLFVGLAFSLFRDDRSSPLKSESIMFFCAASNQAVVEAIRADYVAEFGRTVDINYGNSQGLLSQIEVSKTGDLYLPADDSYLTRAKEKGLIDEILPIGRQQAVIAVKKGNPKNIQALSDLLRDDVRLVQANYDGAAVGKVTKRILSEIDAWDSLDKATVSYRGTVTEVANDIKLGAADAGIVYDAVLHTYPELEYVEVPELAKGKSEIAVGVIKGTKLPQNALHFARYLSSADRGLKRYKEFGFRVSGGDQWSDVPELSVFAGSMLRPAIEKTIADFERREGIRVSYNYDGCGILVAQIKAGQTPDAYFACDTEFMDQVNDLFPDPVPVSENELVILVEKGNPHEIASLRDLTKPGLRVGIGHEKQCAMGWITQITFKEGGVQKEVMENVTVQTPTGDMLVNQMLTRSLDAAVVYLSNAAGSGDKLDAVQIQGLPCSVATQPWAVAKDSKYPETAGRLFDQINSAKSQNIFATKGFRWKAQ